MARSLIVLVVGMLLGVVATLLLGPDPLVLSDLGGMRPSVAATAAPAEAVVSAAAREGGPEFYRRLADENAGELASMIRQAAAEPSSTERELALAVLLKRYSELDALGAVRLAREAGVAGLALSAVYGAWARKAQEQALAALSTVENPEAAASVAIALIEALGNDAAAFGRVTTVLAEREGEEAFAAVNPSPGPFTPPVSVVSPHSALGLTTQRWADLDPRRAIAVARQVDDERVAFALESAALRVLARSAPDEAFAYFATLGGDSRKLGVLSAAWGELARADPERLLAAAAALPAEARRVAEQLAVQQLAERDPLAAIRYLERMPMTPERKGITQLIAGNYGKRDPAAAVGWARSFPIQDNVVAAVIRGVAEQDPHRALDLALSLPTRDERTRAVLAAVTAGVRDDARGESIANRVLAVDDEQLKRSLGPMITAWSARSPEGVVRWLVANGQNVGPGLFTIAGRQIALRDARNALSHSAQIPTAGREEWMQGVVSGYAESDPQGAIDWLATQSRDEPWYDGAVKAVANNVAYRDAAAAARFIDGLGTGQVSSVLVTEVARNWARRDPGAAAAWALDRPSEPERVTVVNAVVTLWLEQDAAGARQWVLRLPQGATRDGALSTALVATAFQKAGTLDTGLLSAFASDAARQRAVLKVVQGWARNEPARARAAMDSYLTDPALRARAEGTLGPARNDSRERRFIED
jgi:hypothetical protein